MIIFRYFYSNIGSLVDSEQFSKSLYNKGIPGTVIRFVFRTASTTGSKLAIYGSVAFAMPSPALNIVRIFPCTVWTNNSDQSIF